MLPSTDAAHKEDPMLVMMAMGMALPYTLCMLGDNASAGLKSQPMNCYYTNDTLYEHQPQTKDKTRQH